MKLRKTFAALGCSLALATAFGLGAFSKTDDPLVTLSYLTDVLFPQYQKDVLAETDKKIDNRLATLASGQNITVHVDASAEQPAEKNDTNVSYTLLELTKGQTLTAVGVLEIVVRPGSDCTVVSPFSAMGIADLTTGGELMADESVPFNHTLLVPRGNDGRGIRVNNEKSYIMVRGEYSIG